MFEKGPVLVILLEGIFVCAIPWLVGTFLLPGQCSRMGCYSALGSNQREGGGGKRSTPILELS